MGMDVYGKNPKAEVGKYFCNNVWGWRPLAVYLCTEGPQAIVHKCSYWQSNDGDGLKATDSKKLATWLREEIASGRTATYAMEYQKEMDSKSMLDCRYCEATGIRRDAIGMEHGFDKRVVEEDGPRKGEIGWCNACHGQGKVADSDTYYLFSVENCVEFAAFLENSGGFKIC